MTSKEKSKKEKVQIEVEIGARKLHVAHATCPKGHALQDKEVKIHREPSLKVKVRSRGKEGYLYLDPVYGRYDNIEKDINLKDGDVVQMFCPECGTDLRNPEETCQLCSAPMFIFNLPGGGIVEGCTRKGCLFHKIKIVDAEKQFDRMFENNTLESYL
jgi:hypothetical protein